MDSTTLWLPNCGTQHRWGTGNYLPGKTAVQVHRANRGQNGKVYVGTRGTIPGAPPFFDHHPGELDVYGALERSTTSILEPILSLWGVGLLQLALFHKSLEAPIEFTGGLSTVVGRTH